MHNTKAEQDKMLAEIISLIENGETRNVEFKRTYSWKDPSHKAKITKTILAMSNLRDGGKMILGVEEVSDGVFIRTGMTKEDYDNLNFDHLAAHVHNFADPFTEFDLKKIEDDDGLYFAIINVKEFLEQPVICKRQGEEGLKPGVMYTRSRRMPESVPVPTQTEMREILDLAVEKNIRRFQERIYRAGLRLEDQQSDSSKYEEELEGL